MGYLMPFIVLIERRLLRPMWLLLLASVVLVTGMGAHAGKPGKARKIARDLEVAISSPFTPNERWVRLRGGRRMIDAIIISNAADRDMLALRDHVLLLGGTVNAGFSTVQALSVTVPARALAELDERDDVVALSPNRTTRHTYSSLETTTGAVTAGVRTATGATTYSGLDGSGIGIAILDSGVMPNHRNLATAGGPSRVVKQVNMVGQGVNLAYSEGLRPDSTERKNYETLVNVAAGAALPDAYGHGSHVAAVAAGRGTYRSSFDTSGVAPNASIIDVKVLGADGSGTVADVLAGMDWVAYNATKYNIRVVNMSLSAGSTTSWTSDPLAWSARSLVAQGLVVVTAAGNYGLTSGGITFGTIGSPAHDPSVITVGSSNMRGTPERADDVVNYFSSRGPTRGGTVQSNGVRLADNLLKPDLVAPGNAIISAAATSVVPQGQWNRLASTAPLLLLGLDSYQAYGQTLMMLSGTSVSAPVVSGAVALMLQANPGLTPPLVKAILQYSAQALPNASLVEQGAGLLNVDGAVRLAKAMRTDIASRVKAGTITPGSSINITALPTPSSTVAGQTFNWSRTVFVGGRHIASGDALFTQYQPIYDPGLNWVGSTARRTTITYWPATKNVAANTVPQWVNEASAATGTLLTPGVRMGTALAGVSSKIGRTGVFLPTATMGGWMASGSGQSLTSSLVISGGIVLSEGVVLSEGIVLSEGVVLSESLSGNVRATVAAPPAAER